MRARAPPAAAAPSFDVGLMKDVKISAVTGESGDAAVGVVAEDASRRRGSHLGAAHEYRGGRRPPNCEWQRARSQAHATVAVWAIVFVAAHAKSFRTFTLLFVNCFFVTTHSGV